MKSLLTHIKRTRRDKYRKWYSLYRCECGVEKEIMEQNVRAGQKSCGCFRSIALNRRIELQHLHSGEIKKSDSITNFCAELGYIGNERFHFTPVLNGDRWIYKNWVLPETYRDIHDTRNWVDKYGREYNLSIYDILEKSGGEAHLYSFVPRILAGKAFSINGLYLKGYQPSPKANPPITRIHLEKKGGEIVSGYPQQDVAEKADIERSGVSLLIHGKFEEIKGWRLKGVERSGNGVFGE